MKVGEVTDHSAIVWARLTAKAMRSGGPKVVGKAAKSDPPKLDDLSNLDGACPGAAGRVRVRYGTKPDLSDAKTTAWVDVTEKTDFSHPVRDRQPARRFADSLRSRHHRPGVDDAATVRSPARSAQRRTADKSMPVTFAVVTCQMYADLDHADGFHIYPAIARARSALRRLHGRQRLLRQRAARRDSPALARYHWQRMYSLPRHVELLRKFATYWEKDDHDTLKNDSLARRRSWAT